MAVFKGIILVLAGLLAGSASAQDQVLNLYSARHYQTDEALYANFTKQTGIKINRIEAGDDALIERIKNEGANSPADVLITVDAGAPVARRAAGAVPAGASRRCSRSASRRDCATRRPLVRLLDPRARHRLQQGERASRPRCATTKTSPIRN